MDMMNEAKGLQWKEKKGVECDMRLLRVWYTWYL